jgi:hypothetical protein
MGAAVSSSLSKKACIRLSALAGLNSDSSNELGHLLTELSQVRRPGVLIAGNETPTRPQTAGATVPLHHPAGAELRAASA